MRHRRARPGGADLLSAWVVVQRAWWRFVGSRFRLHVAKLLREKSLLRFWPVLAMVTPAGAAGFLESFVEVCSFLLLRPRLRRETSDPRSGDGGASASLSLGASPRSRLQPGFSEDGLLPGSGARSKCAVLAKMMRQAEDGSRMDFGSRSFPACPMGFVLGRRKSSIIPF